MDESKPSTPLSKFRLRSAYERTSADIDPPPAELARSDELVAVERQNRSGQIEVCRNDFSDGPSVAVLLSQRGGSKPGVPHCATRNGVGRIEQLPEPAKPSVRAAKP